MRKIVQRLLQLDLPPGKSAFLWGPRKCGKTYFLHHGFAKPDDLVIDLLETNTAAEYLARPALLRERYAGQRIIIDEIQKVPALLDEVHWLIERRGASFLLTGSSARKLRRGHANLLGGRARRYEMGPLSLAEVRGFDLEAVMTSGLVAPHFLSADPLAELRAYVADYLTEEVAGEARVRNLPAFAEFLRVAAITSSELLNFTNLGREAGVSAKVVRGYVEILEDTLLGARLRPWTRARDRRMTQTEKFYLFDVGVASYLARRQPRQGTPEFGKSFEHYVLMELENHRRYRAPDLELRFWRTASGLEVDFITGDMDVAIEVKGGARVHDGDLRGLRALAAEHGPRRRIVVCRDRGARRTDDGIEVLPWDTFVRALWAGEIVR